MIDFDKLRFKKYTFCVPVNFRETKEFINVSVEDKHFCKKCYSTTIIIFYIN